MSRPRVALIHAVAVAMAPVEAAVRRHWPEAERMKLLDDTLSVDRARTTDLGAREGVSGRFTKCGFGTAVRA